MNVLPKHKLEHIVKLLVEGNSLRGTARVVDVAYNSVLKLIPRLGRAAADYQNRTMIDLRCRRLQIDEIWSFVGMKRHNVPAERKGEQGIGDVWTFVGLCPETKIVPSWLVGHRTMYNARIFAGDLSARMSNKVQITSDGFKVYVDAIQSSFGADADYGMLVKVYSDGKTDPETLQLHTEPGIQKHKVIGNPDPAHISTSFVERQNVTMRQHMRRYTRRTMGFSKKIENHAHATALHFLYYNFAKIHKTLRITPAMAAGISDHVWSTGEIVDLLSKNP